MPGQGARPLGTQVCGAEAHTCGGGTPGGQRPSNGVTEPRQLPGTATMQAGLGKGPMVAFGSICLHFPEDSHKRLFGD